MTSATSNLGWSSYAKACLGGDGLALALPGLLERLVDAADHVEGRLGQLVALTGDDHLEAADRVLELDVLAGRAGELLCDEVGLRQEPLDLACPCDDEVAQAAAEAAIRRAENRLRVADR